MESASTTTFSPSKEKVLVWLLCAMAAVRVFVYSAAFPFFNNVDEESHFDLVVKYSHAELPHTLAKYSPEAIRYIVAFGSPEFIETPEQYPGGKFPPPPWKQPFEKVKAHLLAQAAVWQSQVNHESFEPPLYYAVAGLWLRLGHGCGLDEIYALYWIRFLNIAVAAGLVWLGFLAARIVFPNNIFPRIAVPALLAFIPQDALYSIQSDAFSPLCFGAAFICMLYWMRAVKPGLRLAVIAALSLAAACLVKTANLPLAAAMACALLFDLQRRAKAGQFPGCLPGFVVFAVLSAAPIIAWVVWNKHVSGDFTGAAPKIKLLGWTHKPFTEWWSHPIFTFSGLWTFWSELMARFWRGEFIWLRRPLASFTADTFYSVSSALLLGICGITIIRHFKTNDVSGRALRFSLACVLAAIAFLVLVSISFDFGNCMYPSQAHPFLTSGRLISGAMIPFTLLYAHGLDLVFYRVKSLWVKFGGLAVIVLGMTISEAIVNAPAFASQNNWFHL